MKEKAKKKISIEKKHEVLRNGHMHTDAQWNINNTIAIVINLSKYSSLYEAYL